MPDPATILDLCRKPHAAALPISGGQGVAGSNPVVPTAVGSPLVLVISSGQRPFFILCGGLVVDLGGGGMGTICGPSVDTARFSRGYDRKSRRDCTGWQTPDGGSGSCRFTLRRRSEPTTPAFPALSTFCTSSSRADTARMRRRLLRSALAPSARRAARARHEGPVVTLQWFAPGDGGANCAEPPPGSSPLARPDPSGPSANRSVTVIVTVAGGHVWRGRTDRE
jgi:hypothetical protein